VWWRAALCGGPGFDKSYFLSCLPQTSLGNGSQADVQTNQVDGNACVQLALPLSFHAGSAPPELAVYCS